MNWTIERIQLDVGNITKSWHSLCFYTGKLPGNGLYSSWITNIYDIVCRFISAKSTNPGHEIKKRRRLQFFLLQFFF